MEEVCSAVACEYAESKSVRRGVPSVINTRLTAPFGLGGDIPDLQVFDLGAVIQHFPKTLNRRFTGPDRDFRLPRANELEALEAFQESILLPADVIDPEFDPFDPMRLETEEETDGLKEDLWASARDVSPCSRGRESYSSNVPTRPGPSQILPPVTAKRVARRQPTVSTEIRQSVLRVP